MVTSFTSLRSSTLIPFSSNNFVLASELETVALKYPLIDASSSIKKFTVDPAAKNDCESCSG